MNRMMDIDDHPALISPGSFSLETPSRSDKNAKEDFPKNDQLVIMHSKRSRCAARSFTRDD